MSDSGSGPFAHGSLQAWVVVIEATATSRQKPYAFETIRLLVERLGDWNATGLYSVDRYAVQVDVDAGSCPDALRLAMAAHRQAALDLAMEPPSFLRAEVLTPEMLQTEVGKEVAATPPPGRDTSIPVILYDATRALLGAVTVTEIRRVLLQFVATCGGKVNVGPDQRQSGAVTVDLGLDPSERIYATAEAFSVSGLLLETSLPRLVDDARSHAQALRRQPDRR